MASGVRSGRTPTRKESLMPKKWKTAPRMALHGYMEGVSEARWAAGWLYNLQFALLKDEAYEWLVEAAGGWWMSKHDYDKNPDMHTLHFEYDPERPHDEIFVHGFLGHLRSLNESYERGRRPNA